MVQLVCRAEDDESNLAVTQDTQFVSLLHNSKLAFVEGHLLGRKGHSQTDLQRLEKKKRLYLTIALVSDARYLNLLSTHDNDSY